MKREKVVTSRSNLKWVSGSTAAVCSHDAHPGEQRKAFADYLVPSSGNAAADDADADGGDYGDD